ncbi:hypothetical protein HHK36_032365 [Tetracentron sinense]|uniref:Uncharacterized protein n=1 Tax=Tetracentron sinense TaxID=13715 RepID=A0A834Y828_TETSI|nr:hypothetical protein HHK36_032365 [Tetracentron sinense]
MVPGFRNIDLNVEEVKDFQALIQQNARTLMKGYAGNRHFYLSCIFYKEKSNFISYSESRYNPYVQARSRIDQLKRLGHSVDKVEFILMGGTFMSLPSE